MPLSGPLQREVYLQRRFSSSRNTRLSTVSPILSAVPKAWVSTGCVKRICISFFPRRSTLLFPGVIVLCSRFHPRSTSEPGRVPLLLMHGIYRSEERRVGKG